MKHGVSSTQQKPTVTTATAWDLVTRLTTELHRTMKTYDRSRWSWVGGKKPKSINGELALTHRIIKQYRSPDLAATMRADCYEPDGPPTISVDFYQPMEPYKPRHVLSIDFDPQGHSVTPRVCTSQRQWEPTDSGTRGLTVRVGLRGEGKPVAWLKIPALRSASVGERQHWLKGARRVRIKKTLNGTERPSEELWWIDPQKTPETVSRFVILLYLLRTRMLDFDRFPNAWTFVTNFAHVKQEKQAEFHHGLSRMIKYFAMPQDWRQVRKYLKMALRTGTGAQNPQVELKAEELSVSSRTVYRWLKQLAKRDGKPLRILLQDDSIQPQLERVAEQKRLRQIAVKQMMKKGCGYEAARKQVQRRFGRKESLESIIRSTRK